MFIRLRTRIVQALVLFTAFSASLWAQSAAPHAFIGRPVTVDRKANQVNLPSRRFALANIVEKRLLPLTKDEMKPDTARLAMKAGVHREVEADTYRFSRWDLTPGGTYVWRLGIYSPDASGLRLHIRGFHAGAGQLWLHDGSGKDSEIMGPYSRNGPFADGEFWTDYVLSDMVVLEFQPDGAPQSAIEPPPFDILEISHLLPEALAAGKERRAAASCHLDATCYTEWALTARSVGQIVFEEDGGAYVCSGTLLATQRQSGIPYFLTADHCIPDADVAKTMQVFWMYQTPVCNGVPPSKQNLQRSLGARYLTGAGLGRGDFTLVQLNSVPDTVVFSGWDTAEPAIGDLLTGIHHPTGDYKRIAFGRRTPPIPGIPGTDPNYYYSVGYTEGRVQSGSSGSGLFARPGVLVGTLTAAPKNDDVPDWVCRWNPEDTDYGRFSTHYPSLRQYLEGTGGQTPNPPSSGQLLTSGVPANFRATADGDSWFLNGSQGFRVEVPQGATRLEIRLDTATQNADLNLYARYGKDVEFQWTEVLSLSFPQLVADYSSESRSGNETIVITPQSTPPLRAGVYYIALTVHKFNVPISGSVTAIVTTGGTTPPPATGNALTSGVPRQFNVPAVDISTLFYGANGFTIQVPQGATQLDIRLNTNPANVDIDLYARFGQDVALTSGKLVLDHQSSGPDGDEVISITAQSNPPLRAGTYFIAYGMFALNTTATATVTATVTGGNTPPSASRVLTSGTPLTFFTNPQPRETLLNGLQGYMIQVPQGATRLEIKLSTTPADFDMDLFARAGADPALDSNGRVIADYGSTGADGTESIAITTSSNPPLKAGTYYIALGVVTTNRGASGTVLATVTTAGGITSTALRPGVPAFGNRVRSRQP